MKCWGIHPDLSHLPADERREIWQASAQPARLGPARRAWVKLLLVVLPGAAVLAAIVLRGVLPLGRRTGTVVIAVVAGVLPGLALRLLAQFIIRLT